MEFPRAKTIIRASEIRFHPLNPSTTNFTPHLSLDQLRGLVIDIIYIHSIDLGGLGSLRLRGDLGCLRSDESLTSERSDLLGFRAGLRLEGLLSEEGGGSGEGELRRCWSVCYFP